MAVAATFIATVIIGVHCRRRRRCKHSRHVHCNVILGWFCTTGGPCGCSWSWSRRVFNPFMYWVSPIQIDNQMAASDVAGTHGHAQFTTDCICAQYPTYIMLWSYGDANYQCMNWFLPTVKLAIDSLTDDIDWCYCCHVCIRISLLSFLFGYTREFEWAIVISLTVRIINVNVPPRD